MATRQEAGGMTAPKENEKAVIIDGKPVVGVRASLWMVLQSRGFQGVSMMCTLYALFAPDVCYGFLPASSDNALLSVVLSVVFFFFILEGVATVIARPRSVCELFFYLDVIATLSLIAVRWLATVPVYPPCCVFSLPVPTRRTSCGSKKR